jgi:adenylate cyclase
MNLGSRLEGLTKHYGVPILVSGACLDAATRTPDAAEGDLITREIDRVRVKGRAEPVTVHEILGVQDGAVGEGGGSVSDDARERTRDLVVRYGEALNRYYAGDLDAARARFEATLERHPDDAPSRRLAARCERLHREGLPSGWDGVWDMEEK